MISILQWYFFTFDNMDNLYEASRELYARLSPNEPFFGIKESYQIGMERERERARERERERELIL